MIKYMVTPDIESINAVMSKGYCLKKVFLEDFYQFKRELSGKPKQVTNILEMWGLYVRLSL